jgi:hypothetical protein
MLRLGMTSDEKHLLRVIAMQLGLNPNREIFMAQTTLSDAMETSVRTVQRATAGLVALGLIVCVGSPRKGRGCKTWRLCAAALWELAGLNLDSSMAETTRQPGGSLSEPGRQPDGSVRESTRQPDASIGHPPYYEKEESEKEEAPPISPSWKSVEEALRQFPLDQADAAIVAARRNGLSPTEVLALIDVAEQKRTALRSPAGALYQRIVNGKPGRPADAGWPAVAARKRERKTSAAIRSVNDPYWRRFSERQHESD